MSCLSTISISFLDFRLGTSLEHRSGREEVHANGEYADWPAASRIIGSAGQRGGVAPARVVSQTLFFGA